MSEGKRGNDFQGSFEAIFIAYFNFGGLARKPYLLTGIIKV